ncbi:MAG: hypothetical protein LBV34_08365 [Nocardiopsaceae bacterium]|jgi:hypothetical protein|nr:hypothetical protein [Nocardiopsaceae bacterium]
MRRRVIGATLTALGVIVLFFEPVRPTGSCPTDVRVCGKFSATSWWGLINYPPGWDRLFLPMFIIGVVLGVTGIVLLVMRKRPLGSASMAG